MPGFVVLGLFITAPAPLRAINLNLTLADVERALAIARARDSEREQFHTAYIKKFDHPFVQSLEIVTEFRRIVLTAEDHIARGDRAFAYRAPVAQDAAAVWKRRVSVVARLRFHPLNTYIVIPPIDIALDGPGAGAALVGQRKEPLLATSGAPGVHIPLLGAIAEAVFDAAIIGQTERNVTVKLDGKELMVARLDFAAVE